jgi:hypothetical protein
MAERGINTKHSDYIDYEQEWDKIDDVISGQKEVKERGQEYLPKLASQSSDQYEAYKRRALFFNATGRTVEALLGMVFRKDPIIELPSNLEDISDDLSLKDESKKGFGKRLLRKTIEKGRSGILVDFPRVENDDVRTRAEAQRNGEFPYATLYEAQEIENWHVERENGNTELKALILHEEFENQDGYFGGDTEEQKRLLELTDDVEGFEGEVYRQQVWRRSANDDEESGWHLAEDVVPRMGGEPLREIPFFFCGVNDTTSELHRPPLLDLVNVNLSHYRSWADLEHGAHFTALPTPYVIGGDAEEMALSIGPSEWVIVENEDGEVGMLEYDGKGLDQLRSVIDDKEEMMADLGARLVMQVEDPSDAQETIQLKQQGQNSILANIVDTAGMAYTKALKMMSRWASGGGNEDPDAKAEFNKDFFPGKLDPSMFKQLLAAKQQGKITTETFISNLQSGEIIDSDIDVEDYKSQTESEAEPDLAGIGRNGDSQ